MRHIILVLLFGLMLTTHNGCAWIAETLLSSAIDEQAPRDGRDRDADGLTERDTRARFEEQAIRNWDNEQQWQQWEESNTPPDQASQFDRDWQDHLQGSDR